MKCYFRWSEYLEACLAGDHGWGCGRFSNPADLMNGPDENEGATNIGWFPGLPKPGGGGTVECN